MSSLAVKYRPKTFKEIQGQTITTKILEKVISNHSFKNVYLFAGKSGCGKTTAARCFANAINNGIGNPIEIDAASNGGVDNVRSIIESANQRALVGEYKVIIIDECHAISTPGWQAFLKGIEEPPKYTIFIFCTTDPNKIPQTVLNRMQRYNFSALSIKEIYERLIYICRQENFINYEQTCDLVSKICNGCMRDAIMYIEQCADFSTDLKLENTKPILGDFSYETMFKLTWSIIKTKDEKDMLSIIDIIQNSGQSLVQFVNLYLEFCLDLTKYIIFKDISLTKIPAYLNDPKNDVVNFTVSDSNSLQKIQLLTDSLLELKTLIKYDSSCVNTVEAYLLKLMRSN